MRLAYKIFLNSLSNAQALSFIVLQSMFTDYCKIVFFLHHFMFAIVKDFLFLFLESTFILNEVGFTFFKIQVAASLEKNLIPNLTSSLPDVEALRFYLTLPECPLMSDSNNFTTIAIPFGTALVNLEKAPLKVLGKNFNIFL